MEKKFLFSVVMPIYNTAPYLDESIGSVIRQSIGFEDHIQLILINDGSLDQSHEICKRYKEQYPDNIIYVEQENMGVSHARNHGLTYATGKYVNFFDSDDIWEPDVFQKVAVFFDTYEDETDVVCCLQKYFESVSGLHGLSKKFEKGSRVIDIHAEPDSILLNVTSVFIKSDVARHYTFDTEISIGEDSTYITEVIFEKEAYGVLQDAVYHIRKRHAGNSLTQSASKNRYTKTVDRYYQYLPELSRRKFGRVIPYVQFAILNGLKFRVLSNQELPLTPAEKAIYVRKIIGLVQLLDDEVIIQAGRMLPATKLYLLKLKHGILDESHLSIEKDILFYKGIRVCRLSINRLELYGFSITGNRCELRGKLAFPLLGDVVLQARVNEKAFVIPLTDHPDLEKYSFTGELIRKNKEFCFAFPLDDNAATILFDVIFDGHVITQKPVLKNELTTLKNDSLKLGNRHVSLRMKKILIENK
ncbi:MAG: glycosyltransferase family 2 protein [Firmicutes bacterium]|nr:glycosyltransferase family 2 protein [Bacillota bacterium]